MSDREENSKSFAFRYSHTFDSVVSAVEVTTQNGEFSYLIPSEHRDRVHTLLDDPTSYTEEEWQDVSQELEQLSEGSLEEGETLFEAKDRILEPYQRCVHGFSWVRREDRTRIGVRIGSEERNYNIPHESVGNLDGYARDVVEGRKTLHDLDESELKDTLETFERISENNY